MLNIDELFLIVSEIKTEQVRIAEQLSNYQKLIDSVQNIALAVRDLANAQCNTSEEVKKLRNDVDEIQKKPSKWIDVAKTVFITTCINGVLVFIISKLLP